MKWLGQYIQDLPSRFRDDVYLEGLTTTTGTDALVVDSNGLVSKNTSIGGDITSLPSLTTIGATGVNTIINSDDVQWYNAVNDGSPQLSIGSSINERLIIQPIYDSGAQTLNYVVFDTIVASGTADKGAHLFRVDDASIVVIRDAGFNLYPNMGIAINGTDILTDSSGTATLSNIDALDATTEATIETAIDTLSNLTTVGTIGTGVWQGTAIASAYLDADTAHYSATRQATHHMILDDIDSDVVYISLLESDAENTSASNKHLPLIAPGNGKLLKIFLRTSVNQSGETFTFKLYTRSTSVSTSGAASEIGAQSGTGPTNSSMVTYDFTSSLDSGTNAINAGDKVQISLEAADGATANGSYFITCLWEWDLS